MPRPKRRPEDGPLLSSGYVIVHCPGHPRANNSGYVLEHILIAERLIGRFLRNGEDVHHYGERWDNTKIVICNSSTYHKLLHTRERALRATGDVHKRKCVYCKRYDKVENMIPQGPTSSNLFHNPCRTVYRYNKKAEAGFPGYTKGEYPTYPWMEEMENES